MFRKVSVLSALISAASAGKYLKPEQAEHQKLIQQQAPSFGMDDSTT
jgi:hypothetical protein